MDCENCNVNLTDCYYGCIIIEKYTISREKKLIEEFLRDLKLLGLLSHPIKDKWEAKLSQIS